MKADHWTDAQVAKLISMVADGYTEKEIAQLLARSQPAINTKIGKLVLAGAITKRLRQVRRRQKEPVEKLPPPIKMSSDIPHNLPKAPPGRCWQRGDDGKTWTLKKLSSL